MESQYFINRKAHFRLFRDVKLDTSLKLYSEFKEDERSLPKHFVSLRKYLTWGCSVALSVIAGSRALTSG